MGSSQRALVVLLHGFLGGRIQFQPMASMLSSKHDVLNYGYRSRADTIEGHSQTLLDTMEVRMQSIKQKSPSIKHVHFVTHSFGGVVLHRAFKDGLADIIGINNEHPTTATRCVMIAPPVGGASLARAFHKDKDNNFLRPEFIKNGLHLVAQRILGEQCGAQLMCHETEWFKQSIGTIPRQVDCLVIVGTTGRINPFINEVSDGIVGVSETVLDRPHFRKNVRLTHNFLLYSKDVWQGVTSFLDGKPVGEWHPSSTTTPHL